MIESTLGSDPTLEAACDEYELACQESGAPNLLPFLEARGWKPGGGDDSLARELACIDLFHRWRIGQSEDEVLPRNPTADDYARVLIREGATPPVEWVLSECDARLAAGESNAVEGLMARYGHEPGLVHALRQKWQTTEPRDRIPSGSRGAGLHVRCPNCQNAIELVPDAELESIDCESCGSDFSLVTDGMATHQATAITQIGQFRLIERVGIGAFGSVWKAHDSKLGRTVAIKIPRKGQFDADQERAFLREARNSAQLSHPGIVPVYEVGRDGDTLYIVSEFIHGVTVADWVTGGSVSARESARVCRDIALALEHAHQRGVVHRDLKPGNVMLNEWQEPRLMDFGLAKRHAEEITMTLDGQVLGTPAYMSPEQARGESKDSDGRSDVYSLGVMLFQMLTSELPFRGNARMLLHQVIHSEPPSPRKLNSSTPVDLETITLKCMAKSPAARYQSAQQVADEFSRWMAGEPIKARPVGPVTRLVQWCKRNPKIASLSAATAATLLLAALVSSVFAVDAKRKARLALELTEEVERVAYRANIRRAREELARLDGITATAVLEEVAFDRTSRSRERFEWRNLMTRADSLLPTVLTGNTEWASSVVFDESGESVFASCSDGALLRWDVTKPSEPERVFVTPGGPLNEPLYRMAIASDEKLIAATQKNGANPTAWVLSGTDVTALTDLGTGLFFAEDVAISPGADFVAVAGRHQRAAGGPSSAQGGAVNIWRMRDGQVDDEATAYRLEAQVPVKRIAYASLAPNRPVLIGVCSRTFWDKPGSYVRDTEVLVWDAQEYSEEPLLKIELPGLDLRGLAACLTRPQFAVSSFDRTHIIRIDAETLQAKVKVIEQPGIDLAFSPDGASLAGGGLMGYFWIADSATGSITRRVKAHTRDLVSIAFSRSGRRLVTSSVEGDTKLWDIAESDGDPILDVVSGDAKLVSFAFSPDSKQIAATYSDGLRLWDVNKRAVRRFFKADDGVTAVCFYPDGERLIYADGSTLRTIDLSDWGVTSKTIDTEVGIISIDISRTGDRLVLNTAESVLSENSGERDATGILLDAANLDIIGHVPFAYGHLNTVKFSPSGKTFAISMMDASIQIRSAETCELIRTLKGMKLGGRGLAFVRCGSEEFLYVTGWDNKVSKWSLTDGAYTELIGQPRPAFDIAVAPNNRTVASLGERGTLVFWDSKTDEHVTFPPESDGFVHRLQFSPDGRLLAVQCDGAILLKKADLPLEDGSLAAGQQ